MKILCPAKINLTLEVLTRQPNGFHALRSVMVPVAIYDELAIEEADSFAFSCDDAALSNDENIVVRAARALASPAPATISLRKRIPSQAGLGGGSSDAAGVLRAAMAGALPAQPKADWIDIARSLGSDVPFFLAGTAALVEGTGERVTALGALPPWHAIVVKPPVAVSTAHAYATLDRAARPSRPRNTSQSLAAVEALQRGDFERAVASLCNDFHDVIAREHGEIRTAIDALERAGAAHPLLAGSGSAVFALAPDAREASAIVSRLDLPDGYLRFDAAFAADDAWRRYA